MHGLQRTATRCRNRRPPLNTKHIFLYPVLICTLLARLTYGQSPAFRITIDQAIEMAMRHNHNLQATRTNVQQNQAQEITANVRPNPVLFADWEYLPIFSRSADQSLGDYLRNSTEGDI